MATSKKTKVLAKSVARNSPELALISNMAEILNSTGLTEIELEQKGVRLRVSKSVIANYQTSAPCGGSTGTACCTCSRWLQSRSSQRTCRRCKISHGRHRLSCRIA